MEYSDAEFLSFERDIHPGAVERLVDHSLIISSGVLSRYLLSSDFGEYSPDLHIRMAEEIRLSKQTVLSNALHDEWIHVLDNDYPLHRAVGLDAPQADDSDDGLSRWRQPLIIPELPQDYVDACLARIMQIGADFRDLDEIHQDYADKPKLLGLLQSLHALTTSGYNVGTGDKAFELVHAGLFKEEYTLEYDSSLYLMAFFPQSSATLAVNMLSANQISRHMDEDLRDVELDEDEQDMLIAIREVLRAEALTGVHWYEFARRFGGINAHGMEQTEVSADGLQALFRVGRISRRSGINQVTKAYLAAIESICYGVMGMMETVSANEFAAGDPSHIARAPFNTPLRMVLSSDPKLRNVIQPVKSGLKAVIVDESLRDTLIAELIINEQSCHTATEDTMYRNLDPKAEWIQDPAIAQVNIAVSDHHPVSYLDAIKSIIDRRMEMSKDLSNPDFTMVIWSGNSETVAAVYEWFGRLAIDDDEVRGSLLIGDMVFEAPYHVSGNPARINIRVQPKQAILPRPKN